MADVAVPDDFTFGPEHHSTGGAADFNRFPIVWAETVNGPDGVVAGFVTCNGEIWCAEALLFNGEEYAEHLVGYFKDQRSAVRAVLNAPDRMQPDIPRGPVV